MQNLVKQDPVIAVWCYDLSASYNLLGLASEAQVWIAAKAQYQSDLEIAQKLVKQDPSNAAWQRTLVS